MTSFETLLSSALAWGITKGLLLAFFLHDFYSWYREKKETFLRAKAKPVEARPRPGVTPIGVTLNKSSTNRAGMSFRSR